MREAADTARSSARSRIKKTGGKAARGEQYIPGQKANDLKVKFAKLNAFVTAHSGFVTSIPGAPEVTVECLPDSSLPAELLAAGYDLHEDGEGQRILPHAIVERFTKNADGTLSIITEGSTQPVTSTVSHAGIVKVLRFRFSI